jgi:hypothetical protein
MTLISTKWKKIGITTIFFLFFFTANSQILIALLLGDKLNTGKIEFGLDGGINFSEIAGMDSNNKLNTWNLGFYFDINLKNQWVLNTGVLVKSSLGLDDLSQSDVEFLEITDYNAEGSYSQKINYFIIPALAKYKFKNNFYVEAGPQFGFMYKAWTEYNSDSEGKSVQIKQNNKDMINRFDAGISAGTGYRLLNGLGMTLGVRYYYGLLDVYKNRSGTQNNSLFLKLNIPIGITDANKELIKKQKELNKEKKAKKKQQKLKNK